MRYHTPHARCVRQSNNYPQANPFPWQGQVFPGGNRVQSSEVPRLSVDSAVSPKPLHKEFADSDWWLCRSRMSRSVATSWLLPVSFPGGKSSMNPGQLNWPGLRIYARRETTYCRRRLRALPSPRTHTPSKAKLEGSGMTSIMNPAIPVPNAEAPGVLLVRS